MKKIFLFLQFTLAVTLISSAVSAQKLTPVSEPYWIIESNVKTPKKSTVYFYSTAHEVMYKETVDGKRLNVHRLKVRRILNETLKEVSLAWMEKKINEKSKLLAARKI